MSLFLSSLLFELGNLERENKTHIALYENHQSYCLNLFLSFILEIILLAMRRVKLEDSLLYDHTDIALYQPISYQKLCYERKQIRFETWEISCVSAQSLLPCFHNWLLLLAVAVWGGDPVYPTVNYIQDPNVVIDYRGPNLHEPTPNMLSYLKEVSTSQNHFFSAFELVARIFTCCDLCFINSWCNHIQSSRVVD